MDIRDLPEEAWYAVRRAWSSRKTWVWVGDVAQWFAALGALWYLWSRGLTLVSCLAALVACAACQAVAVAAVVLPGQQAGSKGLMDHHQGITVAVVCLTWIFGVIPAAPILHKTLDDSERQIAAVFVAGMALMLTSIAGLIAVTALSPEATEGSPHELPDEPDWVDVADAGTVDV